MEMNDNFTIFYGEYSLRHWLDLILKKKIILPPYQRRYVWNNNQIKKFAESIEKSFVPPIIIGRYKQNDKSDNADYIIDGQQRLTTLLLLYYGIFPAVLLNKKDEPNDEPEDEDDEESDGEFDKPFSKWIIQDFQDEFQKDFTEFREKMLTMKNENDGQNKYEKYEENNFFGKSDLLEKYFLGFSYIHTNTEKPKEQKEFFGRLFEKINTGGKALSILESREALYHIGDYAEYLSLDWLDKKSKKNGMLTKGGVGEKDDIDFCRILALLNDYVLHKENKKYVSDTYMKKLRENAANRKHFYCYVAGNYSNKLEEFIKNYVETVNKPSGNSKVLSIFDSKRFEELKAVVLQICENKPEKNYSSIIYADYDLFGAVYWILFEGKDRNYIIPRLPDIQKQLEADIEYIKKDINAKKEPRENRSPNQLARLRRRIGDSIWFYASEEDKKK
ncbi:hypothetical protein R83H12_00895 [Fibrobacteria bacterium R8-3-H12]